MLALAWIFSATLLLSLGSDSSALPTGDVDTTDTTHLRAAYLIEGQPPPPCVNEICPLSAPATRAAVPIGVQNLTSNATMTNSMTGNTAGGVDGVVVSDGKTDVDSDVPSDCASLADEEEPNYTHPHSAKPSRLRAAIRFAGEPDPPCYNHICPMSQGHRSDVIESSAPESNSAQPKHVKAAFKVSGSNQTVPASCRTGKVRCLASSPDTTESSHHGLENSASVKEKTKSFKKGGGCRANHSTTHFPGTHQTAPVTCGDGTKPPCGKNHSLGETPRRFPGTHQTAPITCGDGTRPPCGNNHPIQGSHFSGTHQTAPISCGDGTKPPCGKNQPHAEAQSSVDRTSNSTLTHNRRG